MFGSPVPKDDDNQDVWEKISQDGKLSLARLQEHQPQYAEACRGGIEWEVFRWPLVKAFPWVPDLIQEAGNAGQAIAHCENRLELMLKIAKIANRKQKDTSSGGSVDWTSVVREATRAGGDFKGEVQGFVDFVKQLSGGLNDPWVLHELRDFCRQLPSHAIIKGHMAKSVANAKIGGEGGAPLFRLACMKAMASASHKFRKGDEQCLMKPSDISSLENDKRSQIVMQAESMLQQLRKIVRNLGVAKSDPIWSSIVGLADIRVVHFVLNKPDESRGIFKNISAIGSDFCAALSTATQKTVTSPCLVSEGVEGC